MTVATALYDTPILVVDDERANGLLLQKIFEKQGFRHIVTTTDPTAASSLYQAHRPGVVLLDLQMPVMDGFAVMEQLQAAEDGPSAPIIILSAQDDQDSRVRALRQGARDYVTKPFNQVELLTRVENTLALRLAEEQRLHVASHFDPVTELPNRDYGLSLLAGLLEASNFETSRMALLVVETEAYERLVQSFGYGVADTFLRRCIDRLQTALAPFPHMMARLEGGRILLGLRGESAWSYTSLTRCAGELLEALDPSEALAEVEVRPEPRMGAALYPLDADTLEGLLAEAQSALVQLTGTGDTGLAFADSSANQRLRDRLRLEAQLVDALDNGELFVAYQPQYALADGRIVGAEALMRWQSPAAGRISPAEFIPALEETGLIHRAGEWLVHEVFAQLARWREAGHTDLQVALNLSPRQIDAGHLPQKLSGAAAAHGVPPSAVELEVTESLLLSGRTSTRDVLRCLETMGFSIALDDFGTGYSALSYLHSYPFHKVKIDRSFIDAMDKTEKGEPLVNAIVHLARQLGLVTVAEGIEESAQEARLRAMECEIGQGFRFSRPLAVADFSALLAAEAG